METLRYWNALQTIIDVVEGEAENMLLHARRPENAWRLRCTRRNADAEAKEMHIPKQDIPVKIQGPGAIARVKTDFGDASGYRNMSGEYFSLGAGADLAPLLVGLQSDLCQSPHWGYLLQGEVVVTYGDATEEVIKGGDLFYWPPGHTVRANQDAEIILFSPQAEHGQVLDHVLGKMQLT